MSPSAPEKASRRLAVTRAAGVAVALLNVGLWLVFLFRNPYAPHTDAPGGFAVATAEGQPSPVAELMVVLWLLAAGAALWLPGEVLLLLGLVTFLPVGLYVLFTPGVFSLLGIGNLVYIVLAVLILLGRRAR